YSAWEADILPMNYTCIGYIIPLFGEKSNPLFQIFYRQLLWFFLVNITKFQRNISAKRRDAGERFFLNIL
ncbi:MAG: hypothetical protein J6K89_04600, partial [Oscillospiraceae bacterium]|nr:hypothetical protein [Oscillospiraceae bacterium]